MNLADELKLFTEKISSYILELEKISLKLSKDIILLGDTNKEQQIQKSIFKIMVLLQNEDIIQQEIGHIHDNLQENSKLFNPDISKIAEDRDIYSVVKFILIVTEKQMNRICADINTMIENIEIELFKIKNISEENNTSDKSKKMLENIVSFKYMHREMKNGISILSKMKQETDFSLNLNDSAYKDSVIKKIINNLTVDEERTTILEEFPELEIESTTGNNITLF